MHQQFPGPERVMIKTVGLVIRAYVGIVKKYFSFINPGKSILKICFSGTE